MWLVSELDAITDLRISLLRIALKVESGWCEVLGRCRDDDEGLVYSLVSSLPVSVNWGPLYKVTSRKSTDCLLTSTVTGLLGSAV